MNILREVHEIFSLNYPSQEHGNPHERNPVLRIVTNPFYRSKNS